MCSNGSFLGAESEGRFSEGGSRRWPEVPRKTGYWILGGYQWWAVRVGSSGGLWWWAVIVGSGGLLTDTNDAAGGRLPIGRGVQCRLYQRRAG